MKFFEYRIRWWDLDQLKKIKIKKDEVTLELIAQKFFIGACDLHVSHM